ncbi:MAG TPA: methylated-DNA--[protein]-cysteine S-methyltransferase [Candidatus Binatia bacterium]|jgi:methylated-DNA-[protein]-cysteine S-methyltransferase|nr:methylated-DNA--[protein]-cysteine S-methyltransferase [Candidatus Binatia bacterium]
MVELFIDRIDSPIGTLLLVSDGERLCALDYIGYEERMMTLLHRRYCEFRLRNTADPQGFSGRIRAYLAGDLGCLNGIPVNLGGTAFQQEAWSALRTIPPGTVLSYGEMAARLGKPASYRAVGMVNALNPIAIVIPCHRLVGASGALTGYAGGLARKRWLLQHEGVDLVKLASVGTVTKDRRAPLLWQSEA